MPTKFRKFLSGKVFPILFLLGYILFSVWATCTTAIAAYTLSSAKWVGIITAAIFVFFAILILQRTKYSAVFIRKGMAFLRCSAIYYSMWFLIAFVVAILPVMPDTASAILILSAIPAAVITTVCGYVNAKKITTKRYDLTLGNTGNSYRIALISDIHMGLFARTGHIKKIAKAIKKLSPNLIVIAGDIFDVDNSILDDKDELKKIGQLFRKLKSRDGIYAVLGNHDPKADDPRLVRFLKNSHIHLLDNETKELSNILLVGRSDEDSNIRKTWSETVPENTKKPIVVLDHKPQGIDEAAKYGASLVLSGHTHKGQFFPITYFTKLANGKSYFYGLNKIDSTYGITTAGVGFFELPVRLMTRNEVVDIQLKL